MVIDLVIRGTPTFPVFTGYGKALQCSSGNGMVHTSGGPFEFASAHDFTLEFWMMTTASLIPNQQKTICGWGTDGYAYFFTNGKVGIYLPPGDATGNTCATVCNDGNPHYISFSYDLATTTLHIHRDGIHENSAIFALAQTGGKYQNVGCNYDNGGTAFDFVGMVDEIRVSDVARYGAGNYTPPATRLKSSVVNTTHLYHFDEGTGKDYAGLAAVTSTENIEVVRNLSNHRQLQVNPTGLITPLSYEWFKTLTPGFNVDISNALADGGSVSGATTNLLDETGPFVPDEYYKSRITDSDGNQYVTYHRPMQPGVSTTIVKLGVIGNSQMSPESWLNDLSCLDQAAQQISVGAGYRDVQIVNAAVPGAVSAYFYDSTQSPGSRIQTSLTDYLAAWGGSLAGVDTFLEVAINDAQGSVAASVFGANIAGIVAFLRANGGDVLMSYPMPREPGLYGQVPTPPVVFTEDILALCLQYITYIDALVDNVHVVFGDRVSFRNMGMYPQTLLEFDPSTPTTKPGALHSSALGSAEAASQMANAWFRKYGLISFGAPAVGLVGVACMQHPRRNE